MRREHSAGNRLLVYFSYLSHSADDAVGQNFFETAGVQGATDGPTAHDAVASDGSGSVTLEKTDESAVDPAD